MDKVRVLNIIIILCLITGIISSTSFPNITLLETEHPIVNETMFAAYPNLWLLDMSYQTRFEFPSHRVFLIHNTLSRYLCNKCGIHSIYQISLSKLPQLSQLIIEHNQLHYIHPDAFQFNPKLEKISLKGNKLFTFNQEATIRHISALTSFDLSWNAHFDLNKVNMNAEQLMFFKCKHCGITFLAQETMKKMPRLSMLNLAHNKINMIRNNSFMLSKYLKMLHIDYNKALRSLNLTSTSLEKLYAEFCGLEGTFQTSQLPKLEYLNVRGNRINRLDEDAFQHNPNIKTILLDDNWIEKVPMKLLTQPLNYLQRLCFDRNPLQPCDQVDQAKEIYSIRRLRQNCSEDNHLMNKFENFLPHLNGTAVYRKGLLNITRRDDSTVDLSNRTIVYIEPHYLADWKTVKTVSFDSNHNFNFQQDVEFLISSFVETIFLRNCSIATLYVNTFKSLPNLRNLHLEGNQIQSIISHSLFQNNKVLRFLNLSENWLVFIIPNAFKNNLQLDTLLLDRNYHLTHKTPVPFLVSHSLKKLSCRYCKFVQLNHLTLSGLPDLTELDLGYNQLKVVERGAFLSNVKLRYLNLEHNEMMVLEPEIYQLGQQMNINLEAASMILRDESKTSKNTHEMELTNINTFEFIEKTRPIASSAGTYRFEIFPYVFIMVLIHGEYS